MTIWPIVGVTAATKVMVTGTFIMGIVTPAATKTQPIAKDRMLAAPPAMTDVFGWKFLTAAARMDAALIWELARMPLC